MCAKKAALVKVNKPAEDVAVKPVPDLFEKLGNKAVFVALGLILLIGVIVFKDYLSGQKVYLFKDIGSDTLNGLYPYMCNATDYIQKYGLPKWSFSYGMGQSMFPLLLRDPFDIFLYPGGKDHLAHAIVYKELAKVLLGGITFFYYLKALRLSDYTAIAGSLLFAFCAFMIVGGGWYYFSYEAFNMALLLLAFERLFTKGKWLLFPVAIAIIGVAMPFNLYVYGIFLAVYAVFRTFQENVFSIKDTGVLFLRMAGLGLIGILISAPFFIENLYQLLESPRGSGGSSYVQTLSSAAMFAATDKVQLGTCIMRFFASDILGSGNNFKGWQNILEAPMFYCGLPCLLLLPQVFPFLNKKRKIAFAVFLGIWLMPIIFPYFRYAFWLFAGDYYRAYSFLVSLVFLFYSLFALDYIVKQKKINLVVLTVTVATLFILLNYPFFPDSGSTDSALVMFVSCMLVVYAVLLYFMSRQKSGAYLKYIFLLAVVLELVYLSGISVNEREAVTDTELAERTGYNDYSNDALNYIRRQDKSFYRIDKNYASSPAMHFSLNDAMVQGYNGTSSYSSFNQKNYIGYLQEFSIIHKDIELESRWPTGLIMHPLLESENNVKYILAHGITNPIWRVSCDSVTTFGNVILLKNKFTLPFGYTYDSYVRESAFTGLSSLQKDILSLRACVVKDGDAARLAGMKEFQMKDTLAPVMFSTNILQQCEAALKKDTLTIDQFSQTLIKGRINTGTDKMMYLSVPYDDGWHARVDGREADRIMLDGGMTGLLLKQGAHTIEMGYDLRFFKKGLLLCLLGIVCYAGLWFISRRRKAKSASAA